MVALTGFQILAIAFVVVIAIVVVALMLYLLRLLKKRKAKLLSDLDQGPSAVQDRAFNRLAMARRESRILSGSGVDVHHAEELIAQSQGAFDNRHFDRSYELAQSAHEALVSARQQGARTTGVPLPSSGAGTHPTLEPIATSPPVAKDAGTVPAASAEAPRPVIPKNRAESQFQIRLLGEELAALPARRARDPSGVQATELKRQASEAFDREQFTEAFRLALRGRRALGDDLGSVPPPGTHPAPAASAAGTGNGAGGGGDIAATAESVAGGERCPECGYPALPGDAFCRGCGKPRSAMTCPSCGSPRGADEPFCGRCGTRYS